MTAGSTSPTLPASALRRSAAPIGLPALTAMDVAVGWPLGSIPPPPRPDTVEPDPARALRDALRPALLRPPCVVSFSGGRDSSLLLVVAADLAAREGLAPPIALTFRYPGDPAAEESAWQELVIEHLRRAGTPVDWVRHDVTTEMDNIGPLTAPMLRAHRTPTFPAGLGNVLLQSRYACGGSLVTGNGGDEVLGEHRTGVLRAVLRRRGRGLRRGDWRLVAASVAPAAIRFRLSEDDGGLPWLRAHARAAALREARRLATAPLAWGKAVLATRMPRAIQINNQTRTRMAADHDCRLVEPLGTDAFVHSYAAFGGRWGGVTRTAAIRMLAAELLPEATIRRGDKASFNASRFGCVSREFARSWDGCGLDPELVDAERLREAWLSEVPPGNTGMLLQQAWLAASDRGPQ